MEALAPSFRQPVTAASGAGSDEVLRQILEQQRLARRAESRRLVLVSDWVELHATDDETMAAAVPVGEGQWMPLAGEGTPLIEEFAVAELAASLGLTQQQGLRLVGDVLELSYRLPRTWARIVAGDLEAWRGRLIAEQTRHLSIDGADWLDRQVAPFAHRLTSGRVRELASAALLRFAAEHPDEVGETDPREVGFDRLPGGYALMSAVLDPADADALRHSVGRVSEELERLGDDGPARVRESKALGLLADPQLAMELLAGELADGDELASHRRKQQRGLTLYVHVSAEDLATGAGVARVEGWGPVALDVVRAWVGRADLHIRPVIDVAERVSVDAYEIPERLREQILLRDPVCVFPWCGSRSHRRDIDHIVPYDTGPSGGGGPPGQTNSENLAPLCRFHHRLKTHGGWTYRRDGTGDFHWVSPAGRRYTVTRTGTRAA